MTTYERGNSLELDGEVEFDSPITAGGDDKSEIQFKE